MSCAAMLILSSPAVALQTRCLISPALRARECWWCITEFDRAHHQPSTSLNLKAVGRSLSDGSPRANRSTAAKAGLGRFSGAIHGNSKGKSPRRRGPLVQEDEHSESCDEHQESSSGGGDTLTAQRPENSGDSSAEEDASCEAFAAAEGVISEDASSDDAAQQLSYNRYLLEMGVSPRSLNGKSEAIRDSESRRTLHGTPDESSTDDNALQMSDDHQLADNGVFSQAGSEAGGQGGDQGDERTEELKTKRAGDAKGALGKAEKSDSVLENETKNENGSISVDRTFSVVSPTTDHIHQPPPLNEGEDRGFGSGAQTSDRIADSENAGEHRSGSNGGPIKKKRRRKLKSKGTVDTALKSEERDDKERVRASPGGAERPAAFSDEGLKKVPAMNGSVTALKEGESSEPNGYLGTAEAPEKDLKVKSSSLSSLVAESADIDSQSSIALDRAVVPNSVSDANSDDSSPHAPNVEATPSGALGKVGSQVETVLEQAVQTAVKVVPLEIVEQAAQVASKVVELPAVVVEQAAQVVEILPDVVTEQVGQVVDQVVDQVSDFAEQVSQEVSQVVDHVSDVAEQVANTVNEQVEYVAESVSQVAEQVTNTVDTVASTASQVVDQVAEFFSSDDEDDSDSDDEFEAYITSDLPEFRGRQGLDNFIVKQEDQGVLSKIYDLYTYMLKQSFPKFAAAMFCAPILVSTLFTLLYLPEFDGLALDETARDFAAAAGGDSFTLQISWKTIFQVFMFSLSLSTGLQPELAPLSPYTLVVANLNALVAQLVFVFLSGAVFARLSQPSQPLRCSEVALVSASPAQRRRKESSIKVFMARYVLAGPQPCELVDVKVDLTYKYNTHTRTGSFFRATQSLKLVRPEIAFLTHGMLVRHVIDETSPLYQRTPEMLNKEDAVFCLSVVGLERASMQSVFHVQHYCVVDNDLVWDAEFEDIILINKKNRRVVDHSRLSMWRPLIDVHN